MYFCIRNGADVLVCNLNFSKMKKFLILVGALLTTTVMHAQYFCSTPKAELHYVNYDEAGQSVSDITAYVQNVDKSSARIFTDYLLNM